MATIIVCAALGLGWGSNFGVALHSEGCVRTFHLVMGALIVAANIFVIAA